MDQFEEEAPTIRICIVCDGRGFIISESSGKYSSRPCDWCSDGIMSEGQWHYYLRRASVLNM